MPKEEYIPYRHEHSRFPGIMQAARDLRCDRTHLYRVLTGERESRRLTARWNAWLKKNPQFARLQKETA